MKKVDHVDIFKFMTKMSISHGITKDITLKGALYTLSNKFFTPSSIFTSKALLTVILSPKIYSAVAKVLTK